MNGKATAGSITMQKFKFHALRLVIRESISRSFYELHNIQMLW